jgi:hypothetical protein
MAADLFRGFLLDGLKARPGLADGFIFSQGSLQDFVDCPRRFLLRYMLHLSWPALQSEPVVENERLIQQGERFHRLAQQYWLGVPDDRLDAMIHDDELHNWWGAFTRQAEGLRNARGLFSEVSLSAPVGNHRLVAQYDLLVAEAAGKFTIYDWKTSRRKPRRTWLVERQQTRIYPYLLARAGSGFNGGQPIVPEDVRLVYWYPAHADQPESFNYSSSQYAADEGYLKDVVGQIARRAGALSEAGDQTEASFPLTERIERCRYCVFRSLCERGERAGLYEGEADPLEESTQQINLDFEQIAEIEF